MVSIRIVPSESMAPVNSLLMDMESPDEMKRRMNYKQENEDEDDEATVDLSIDRSGSLSSEMMESAACCAADVAFESSSNRRVSFGKVEIHEHAMILGGAGIPRLGGAPITMGWQRQAYHVLPVETYDDHRVSFRTGEQLLLSKEHRMQL